MFPGVLFPVSVIVLLILNHGESYMVGNNPYRQREVVDPEGNYVLEWEYEPQQKIIEFNVTVRTEGFVGLGLAEGHSMLNADFFVAGVSQRGDAYGKDMHTKGNRTLVVDQSQDWTLLEASEEAGVTFLRFARPINTCDEDDIEIKSDRMVILWAYGETDTLGYHYQNRGFVDAYLLDPNVTPFLEPPSVFPGFRGSSSYNSPLRSWALRKRSMLESKPTQYLSSIHRGPRLAGKHHAIGFRTYLGNQATTRHAHHLVLYRCAAPAGLDPKVIFEPFVDFAGEEFYFSENRRLPVQFCQEFIYVWAIGGKPYFLDESVGMAIGDRVDEYLLLQMHFDNGDLREPTQLDYGVDLFLTPAEPSRNDGRMLLLSFNIPGALVAFPPASLDFKMIGNCDSQCTQRMFPTAGVRVSGLTLHSHRSARKLRLRQFRNGVELAPVLSDDNYNPTFQQYRQLQEKVTLLPGDQFVMQCELDNSQFNGSTVGGLGTHQEMCSSFVIIDQPITNDRCVSEYPAYRMLPQLGVQNVTWDTLIQERVVTSPRSLRGLTLGQASDLQRWTSEKRRTLQEDVMYAAHAIFCPSAATPSAQDILREAGENLRTIENKSRARIPNVAVTYSGTGFSNIPGNNRIDPKLQEQVQRAAQRQRRDGALGLLQDNDPGAVIMRASTGSPFIEVRVPAMGLASSLGTPATGKFPQDAKEYREPTGGECGNTGAKGYEGYQISFWEVEQSQPKQKQGGNVNSFPFGF